MSWLVLQSKSFPKCRVLRSSEKYGATVSGDLEEVHDDR